MESLFVSVQNSDLLILGIVNAAIGILGFIIFRTNPKSITNKTFFLFSIITIVWGIFNYLNYHVASPFLVLWFLRAVIFLAVWHAFTFFQLFFIFPLEKIKFSRGYVYLFLFVLLTSLLTLTPLVFSQIQNLSGVGNVSVVKLGPGIALFGLMVTALILSGIGILIKKTVQSTGVEKRQLRYMAIGTILTFLFILIFNFLLPIIFENVQFIPYGSLFIFPFVAFTFYAIHKHGFLNTKIISTEILIFFLAVAALVEVIFSNDIIVLIMRTSVFLLVLALGILLIQSVRREVEQREKLEKITKELETVNTELKKLDQAKSEFISIASHQLRAPLTVIRGYISMLLEGSYGKITEQGKEALDRVNIAARQLIKLLADLLDLSRIESGKVKYEFTKIDFVKIISEVVEEFRPSAEKKNLKLSLEKIGTIDELWADQNKIREVVVNLIDNAIKYSSVSGAVVAKIETAGERKIIFSVRDGGMGIKKEDINSLFAKFSRTEDAQKLDPNGMGIGLFFVKKIVEDHGGKVWVESEGAGKGSTFFVELPVKRLE